MSCFLQNATIANTRSCDLWLIYRTKYLELRFTAIKHTMSFKLYSNSPSSERCFTQSYLSPGRGNRRTRRVREEIPVSIISNGVFHNVRKTDVEKGRRRIVVPYVRCCQRRLKNYRFVEVLDGTTNQWM